MTSFIRKIIPSVILLCIVCGMENSYADTNITSNVSTDTVTLMTTVSGKVIGGAWSSVSIIVTPFETSLENINDGNANANIAAYGQSICNGNGEYTYSFGIDADRYGKGKYNLFATSENGVTVTTQFPYSTREALSSSLTFVISSIKGKDAEVLSKDILKYEDDLMLDFTEYKKFDDLRQKKVSELIIWELSSVPAIDIQAFSASFKRAVAVTVINRAELSEIYNLMVKYKGELGIEMTKYTELKKESQEYALKIIRDNDSLNYIAFQDRYKEAILCARVTNPDNYMEIKKGVLDYSEILDIDISVNSDYYRLVDKDAVFKEMLSKKEYKLKSEIESSFKVAVANRMIIESRGKDGSTGSTGSSGGSGGGSGVIMSGIVASLPAETAITPFENMFTDLSGVSWAEQSINRLCKMNIINGYDDKSFKPDNNVSRQEFAKILIIALNLLDDNAYVDFEDINKGDWAYKYVASGVKSGIIFGTGNGKFGGGDFVTREDMAVMIFRALKAQDITLNQGVVAEFADNNKISEYAQQSIETLYSNKIILGNEENCFAPQSFATRAEAAVIIDRVLNVLTGGY